jgi:hypothetical protein
MCAPVGEVEPYAAVQDDVYCVAWVAGAREHAAGVQRDPIRGEVYLRQRKISTSVWGVAPMVLDRWNGINFGGQERPT